MVELINYSEEYKTETINRMADFFGYHSGLFTGKVELTDESYEEAGKTLQDWLSEDHELYLIGYNSIVVGFLHLWYKGPKVAWIEDIYVDKNYRSRGIASDAILSAENIVKGKPGYTAICLDVVPRNENALRLYHKLGFDSVSLLTLRKEFSADKRDRTENILGLEFKI
jgi:ribosomal protein S18 acetylase RimI-like enzyme